MPTNTTGVALSLLVSGLKARYATPQAAALALGLDAEFRESDHPRDKEGQFASGEGGGGSTSHQAIADAGFKKHPGSSATESLYTKGSGSQREVIRLKSDGSWSHTKPGERTASGEGTASLQERLGSKPQTPPPSGNRGSVAEQREALVAAFQSGAMSSEELIKALGEVRPPSFAEAGGSSIAYHATRPEFISSIKEHGLKVKAPQRSFSENLYWGDRGEAVYVSSDLDTAKEWAEMLGGSNKEAVILEVHIPKGGELLPDESAGATSHRYQGDIPPSWIKSARSWTKSGGFSPTQAWDAEPSGNVKYMTVLLEGAEAAEDAEFKETEHPRAAGGQFTSGSGSGGVVKENPIKRTEVPLFQHLKKDRGSWMWNNAPEQEVPVSSLTTMQAPLDAHRLKPWDPENAPPIEVAKYRGEHIIFQGNHRAASAGQAGAKTIKAKVLDLDNPKNQKYLQPKYRGGKDAKPAHDSIIATLKRRYRTPQDAVRQLGLDSALLEETTSMPKQKVRLSPAGMVAKGALFTYITPRLAPKAVIALDSIVGDITSRNFASRKPQLVSRMRAATKGKLRIGQDADLEDLVNLIDALKPDIETADQLAAAPGAAPAQAPMVPDQESDESIIKKITQYLEEEGVSPEILNNLGAFLAQPAVPVVPPENAEENHDQSPGNQGSREQPPHSGPQAGWPYDSARDELPENGIKGLDEDEDEEDESKIVVVDEDEDEEKRGEDEVIPKEQEEQLNYAKGADARPITKATMDRAIRQAQDAAIRNQRAIRDAERFVRPWVGEIAMDSATPADVYRATLKVLGVKGVERMHADALRPVLEAQPLPTARAARERNAALAMDSKAKGSFFERFPAAGKISIQ